jgi:hypothetical protein
LKRQVQRVPFALPSCNRIFFLHLFAIQRPYYISLASLATSLHAPANPEVNCATSRCTFSHHWCEKCLHSFSSLWLENFSSASRSALQGRLPETLPAHFVRSNQRRKTGSNYTEIG